MHKFTLTIAILGASLTQSYAFDVQSEYDRIDRDSRDRELTRMSIEAETQRRNQITNDILNRNDMHNYHMQQYQTPTGETGTYYGRRID